MVLNCCCRGDSATANESYAIDWDHLVVFDFSLCSHFSPLYFCLSLPVQVSLSLPFSVVHYLPSASSFTVTQAGAGQLCVSECFYIIDSLWVPGSNLCTQLWLAVCCHASLPDNPDYSWLDAERPVIRNSWWSKLKSHYWLEGWCHLTWALW